MKNNITYVCAILLNCFVFFSCNSTDSHSMQGNDFKIDGIKDEFVSIIDNAALKADTGVNFNVINSVEWTLFYIIPPYTNLDSAETYFFIDLSSVKNSKIEERDDVNLIVFYNKEKCISSFELPRNKYNFLKSGQLDVQQIPKEYCVFIVKRDSKSGIINLKKQ